MQQKTTVECQIKPQCGNIAFSAPGLTSARVLPRMGQATPASRCEPTFRSSETPALLVPTQRHAQCRADIGQGPGHTLKNVHTTNHQSPKGTGAPAHDNDRLS